MWVQINERKEKDKNKPSEEALIAVLNENWAHARHEEEHRAWHLNLYMLALAGILAIAF
jgi:hypothetical protein